MPQVRNFFKNPEAIVAAIQRAERKTSGEIKVHIDAHCEKEVMLQAQETFFHLGMDQLPNKNGVLIYIAAQDNKLCILGDANIDAIVGAGFWNDTVYKMVEHFKKKEFDEGVAEAILEIGRKLQEYFPYDAKNDTNDLPDDISYGGQL